MGTPLKTAELTAPDWSFQSIGITSPALGKTLEYAFPPQTPAPTTSPLGLAVLGLIGAVGAVALLRRE